MRGHASIRPTIPVFFCLALSGIFAAEPPPIAIELGDIVAAPGAKNVPVPITMSLLGGTTVAAWEAAFGFDPAVVEEAWVEDVCAADRVFTIYPGTFVDPGRCGVGIVIDESSCCASDKFIVAPGKVVAYLRLCLKADAPAGVHPLGILSSYQLVNRVGVASCTVIRARTAVSEMNLDLRGGSLTVVGDPAEPAECLGPDAPPPPPPPPDHPVHAFFKLPDVLARPGGSFRMPFIINADHGVAGFSFSVDFDEGILRATGIEEVFARPDGKRYDFRIFYFDDADATPGNGGIDEGYLVGAAIFSYENPTILLPADADVEVLSFGFTVDPDAAAGTTEVRFLDGARAGPSQPISNAATISHASVTPTADSSVVFTNGRATIEPDIAIFLRGDSNGDGLVDIADPIFTLSYLFLGGLAPRCPDAADANDDGRINIADPVTVLMSLFLGPGGYAMGGSPDRDRTLDGLGCGP